MGNFEILKKELKNLTGSILLIGKIEAKVFSIFDKNTNISETFYLNCFNETSEGNIIDKSIADNISLKDLHKYFKDGVDNIYCNYEEIKNYLPSFIRESLRITKKKIYVFSKYKSNLNHLIKKYKRYNLNCTVYNFDNYDLLVVEANDIIVHFFKELYYYIIDNIEKIYNYISDNV